MSRINYINILEKIQLIDSTLNQIIKLMCTNGKNVDLETLADDIILKTNISASEKDIIKQVIEEYIKYGLINKACLFRKQSKTNSYVDLRNLLIDRKKEEIFICHLDKSRILKCVHQKSKCVNCDKWQQDRTLFKQQINQIINEEDISDGLRLLPKTIQLLPTIILEKDSYNEFIKTLEAFTKSKLN